jgi:hypothetical protein
MLDTDVVLAILEVCEVRQAELHMANTYYSEMTGKTVSLQSAQEVADRRHEAFDSADRAFIRSILAVLRSRARRLSNGCL